jgi:hypothetical protein
VLGGPEITGVLVFPVSLLLQPASKQQHKRRRRKAHCRLPIANCQWDFVRNRQSSIVILDCGSLIFFLGKRFTGDAILTLNPPAEVDELAPLTTEWTKRIIFPLDRLTAGWASHESRATKRPRLTKELPVV